MTSGPVHDQHDPDTPAVPPALAARLRAMTGGGGGMGGGGGGVPPEVDEAVLALARAKFAARPRRNRLRLVLTAGSLAAAAGLAVAVWLVWPSSGGPPVGGIGAPVASLRGDVNDDDRVDIVDALLLAEAIRDGRTLRREWDVDGDGRITKADVDEIGRMATSLRVAQRQRVPGDGVPAGGPGGAS